MLQRLYQRLEDLERRFQELEEQLTSPKVLGDSARLQELSREHANLRELVETFRALRRVEEELEEVRRLLREEKDPDLRLLASEEEEALEKRREELERKVQRLLLPQDPLDEKNVMVEIRAGAGGEEAALFAAELCRMYQRFAERRSWRVEPISLHRTGLGGVKEAIFAVEGRGAYSWLKYESGVHRVQRVPETEASGRIHTSTATVAVLPEPDPIEVEINPNDLEIETFLASSAGGQHMQKNETAVRIRHKPTGIVVECQDERSQRQNKEKALRALRSLLYERERRRQEEALAQQRRSQVRSGERSEKVRTYNFPQGRVTDHRIGLTLYRLEEILDGDLEELLQGLRAAEEEERLKELALG